MMNVEEVMIEKVIEDRNSNNGFMDLISNVEESSCVPNKVIVEDCSMYKKATQINVNETSQFTNDCEVIITDNAEIKQNSNKKDDMNEQNKSVMLPNTKQNEILINDTDKNQNTNEDVTFENLEQKCDDDICVIREINTVSLVQKSDKVSSLTSIAIEYGNSDSETEFNIDETKNDSNQSQFLNEVQMQTYRQNKEVSSSEESDSDDSTSSSDSSVIVESDDSDSDDSSRKKGKENNVRRKKNNEIRTELDDLPPIEDLKISVPEVLCDPLGEVAWMVEQLVVVKPKSGKPTLNLDTVLFIEKGQRTLGKIFDVFGQVNEPYYCVRFNSSEHIKEYNITAGMIVYYCPNTEYTSLVFLHELLKIRGIDANADDPPEFSDDEEERAYYEQLKAKQVNNVNEAENPSKRKRISKPATGWQSNHPWNRSMQNQRKGFYARGDRRFPSMQTENHSQNLWSQSYQTNSEPYGYGMCSLQPVQYMNHNVSGLNQNFYGSHNYYSEDSSSTYLNPRIPFNTCPRVPPGYITPQYHPNSSTSVRFHGANMPWLPQASQVPIRMKLPWVPIPPPPPPPPTSSPSDTTST
ncbi:H/ACA ribonucleoprotein complex non-core subunit NAF1 [Bombus pascuorum]|uniref:H/ACA ribonucleoprotein complex non-core subunit NAF1 n=1 Tax=Bombus pascuorum TaxID=65598 RepID=UPI00298E1B75|nr:H/ACA ribonucleoprotein complex non-core subunit NAF1 [Bombus pascuorum]